MTRIYLISIVFTVVTACQNNSNLKSEMAEYYYQTYQAMPINPSEAIKFSDKHIELAIKKGDKQELVKAYFLRGYIYDTYFQNPQLTLKSYLNSISLSKDLNEKSYLDGIFNIGELYFRYGFLRAAAQAFNEGFLRSQQIQDKALENKFNLCLLNTHLKLESWKQGNHYLDNGLSLSIELMDSSSIINYSVIKSNILTHQNKLDESKGILCDILLNGEEKLSQKQRVQILNNLGIIHLKKNNFANALMYLQQALELNKQADYFLKLTLNNLGKVALAQENYNKAENYFQQAEKLPVVALGDENQLDSNEGLAEVYNATGRSELALIYKQRSLDHLKPVLEQVDQLSAFASGFEEWQKSREVLSDKRKTETGMIAIVVFFIVAGIFVILGLYYLMALRKKIRLESEIRVLNEINKFKEAIIYNIRLLF